MLELPSLEIFKKIGLKFQTKNNLKEDIFFNKKKEEEFKKNLVIKSFLCIFLTNFLTYSVMSKDTPIESAPMNKNKGMISMSIALENYLPENNTYEPIKLVGPNNETITNEALIESITEKEALIEDREVPIYIVQLKKADAQKIVQYQNKLIRAYPASIKDDKRVSTGEPYEIKF